MHPATRLLQDLVRRPSINPMGRSLHGPEVLEHQVTAYLVDFFQHLGVPYERQAVAPGRENIVARYEPPSGGPTLLWEVHQDTVPVDGMTIDPFAARIENGKLFGRGACDVKGGMSAMLTAFSRLVRERPTGACRIILACTVDEEFTFGGVTRLVQDLRADMAVVAEPTSLEIIRAHKGVVGWEVTTTGTSCHSSRPERGVNAIYRMGRLLGAIEAYAEHLRSKHPDPLLGPPSLSVGRIDGGVSVNTVPDRCRVEVDRRLIPGEDPSTGLEEFHAWLCRQAGIDFPFTCTQQRQGIPALAPTGSEEIIRRLGHAIDRVQATHQVSVVPYGTDASTIAAAGIPTVVFGPGDIAQAHTADEWIDLDQVAAASEILFELAKNASGVQ